MYQIKALAEKLMPTEWESYLSVDGSTDVINYDGSQRVQCYQRTGGVPNKGEALAAYILAVEPKVVLGLIAEINRLKDRIEELENEIIV